MIELLNKLGKDCGKSLDEMKKLWKEAKKEATRKHLKPGSVSHTQHAFQMLHKMTSKSSSPVPDSENPELSKLLKKGKK